MASAMLMATLSSLLVYRFDPTSTTRNKKLVTGCRQTVCGQICTLKIQAMRKSGMLDASYAAYGTCRLWDLSHVQQLIAKGISKDFSDDSDES